MRIVAKTLAGLETLLAEEVEAFGGKEIKTGIRMVSFQGDLNLVYKLNIASYLSLKILVLLDEFQIRNNRDLYKCVHRVPWEDHFTKSKTFAIDAVVNSPLFKHTNYPALVVKDAIVDRFREKKGIRPSVNTESPDVKIHLHVRRERCSIYLDSTGESLHHRGYRDPGHEAPINEVLAAALVKLSGWDYESTLCDPFCGSGTILIEAARMASGIPACDQRNDFLFQNWNGFQPEDVSGVRKDLYAYMEKPDVNFFGRDISSQYIELAGKIADQADVGDMISFERRNFMRSKPNIVPPFILSNLPYGRRLELEDSIKFHREIGDTLKFQFPGCHAAFLSANKSGLKNIGLKPSSKTALNSGGLELWLYQFDVFAGKLKDQA